LESPQKFYVFLKDEQLITYNLVTLSYDIWNVMVWVSDINYAMISYNLNPF